MRLRLTPAVARRRRHACDSLSICSLSLVLLLAILQGPLHVRAGAALEHADFADLPVSQLLLRADSLLSSGHGGDALELYDMAVERDKGSYLNLYKRGTAHLALGHTNRALDDFEAVLELTEFDQARLQAARIQLRLGAYSAAASSIKTYLSSHKNDATATELKRQIGVGEKHSKAAEKARGAQAWDKCVEAANEALVISSHSTRLLQLRSTCLSRAGKIEEAVGDLNRLISITPNNPQILVRLSLLNALYLDTGSSAITPLKQCLHFDPDDRACKRLFRSLKALEKDLSRVRNFVESSGWRSALNILDPKKPAGSTGGDESSMTSSSSKTAKAAISPINRVKDLLSEYSAEEFGLPHEAESALLTSLYSWTCKAYVALSSVRTGKPFCQEAHRRDPENVDGLVGLGELALKDEEFEEAVRLLSEAFEKGGRSDRSVLEKLQKAQRLLKQSKAKDYYKVLGVSRDADTATIKKAYRRATLKAHPDKGGSEAAMAAVNEAWEVLGNPELKARYDSGDDPNDPTGGQGHQHGGFGGGGGGHPFYGSPGGGMGGQQFFQQFFQQGGGAFGNAHGQGMPFGAGGGARFTWG